MYVPTHERRNKVFRNTYNYSGLDCIQMFINNFSTTVSQDFLRSPHAIFDIALRPRHVSCIRSFLCNSYHFGDSKD